MFELGAEDLARVHQIEKAGKLSQAAGSTCAMTWGYGREVRLSGGLSGSSQRSLGRGGTGRVWVGFGCEKHMAAGPPASAFHFRL